MDAVPGDTWEVKLLVKKLPIPRTNKILLRHEKLKQDAMIKLGYFRRNSLTHLSTRSQLERVNGMLMRTKGYINEQTRKVNV